LESFVSGVLVDAQPQADRIHHA